MPSSGSTRNPPRRRRIRLLVVLANEDHPKACTGRRLLQWQRVEKVPREEACAPSPVVLDPYASSPLSAADRPAAERGGILVVDCSWNRLSARGGFPGGSKGPRPVARHRRLPLLVAANPQHYGRVAQLNTVEAFCAALYLVGQEGEATEVIAGFHGGEEFIRVNRERLEKYRAAADSTGVLDAEKSLFSSS